MVLKPGRSRGFIPGLALAISVTASLLAGCTMYTRNEFLYGSQLGFQPRPVVLHASQAIQSNDPYGRVTRLLAELSRAAPSRWFAIQLVVAPNQCGMCTDGNAVYVHPDFISSFSDEELLGALAHELAHGDLGHIGMVQAAGLLVTGIFRAITKGHHVRDGTVIAHDLTQGFVMGQFSQKQELEADRQAKAYLDALGYDGTSIMISLMGKLQALGGHQWASWFASHPAIPERMASLRDLHLATTAPFSDGSSLQRSLGLIPPANQTPQPSPPVIAKAEGEIISTSEADSGAMALEIKQGDGSTVPVVVGTGSVVYLNEENVTFKPFSIKPGMWADVEYTFDLQRNRGFASSLKLTSAKPVASLVAFPDKQKTLEAHIGDLYASARKSLGLTKAPAKQPKPSEKAVAALNANGADLEDRSNTSDRGGGTPPSPTRVQCPVGKEFYNGDAKTCPIHKVELRQWRQR